MNYYKTLNINSNASQDDIKNSYRKLAVKYHPDKNPGDKLAEDNFKLLVEAYEILSDQNKRNAYDLNLQQTITPRYNPKPRPTPDYDLRNHFRNSNYVTKVDHYNNYEFLRRFDGDSIKLVVNLTKNEALYGAKKYLKLEKYIQCKTCFGNGAIDEPKFEICYDCFCSSSNNGKQCKTCKGEGTILINKCKDCSGDGRVLKKILQGVKIPENSCIGEKYFYKGLGDVGIRNDVSGDLIIEIKNILDYNQDYDICNDGIILEQKISFQKAIFGGTVVVNKFKDPLTIKIQPGVLEKDIFELKNSVVVDGKKKNLYIKFNIEFNE